MLTTSTRRAIAAGALVLFAAAASAVLVTGASGASSSETAGSVGLRATLSSPQVRAAPALFIGTLRGRTLRWAIAYRGLSGRAVSARIRLGRSVAVTLCTTCRRQTHGRRVVTRRVARALTRNRASVELLARAAPVDRLSGKVAVASVPTLEITSPKAGETIELPARVGYGLTGLDLGANGAFLAVYVAGHDGRRVEIPLESAEDVVALPDAKDAFLAGHRDLTFQLETSERVLVPNSEAIVVVRDLTITGRRSG